MSYIVKSPIISLTQLVDSIYEPVSLLPAFTEVILNNNRMIYDPFRTFSILNPLIPAFMWKNQI